MSEANELTDKQRADCLETILGLIMVVPVGILRGFILTRLWAWFVVPLGMNPIGVAHGIGIGVLVGLLFAAPMSKEKDRSLLERILTGVVFMLICWGIGYVAFLCM